MSDPLQEIFADDYEALLSILETRFPESLTFYGWLKSKLSWIEQEPDSHTIHVCSVNGDMENNGVVFYGDMRGRCSIIGVFLFKNDFSILRQALLETKKIKWEESPVVAINIEKAKEMEDLMKQLGFRIYADIGSKLWQLSTEEADRFDITCPDGFYLGPLRPEHIPKVNSLWALKFDGSEKILTDLIELNSSIGLFTKDSNALISWTIECDFSEIGVLHTLPEHRKRGYAQLVVKALAKRIASDKKFVITYTVSGNAASERLFENLGFKYMCMYSFLEYEKDV